MNYKKMKYVYIIAYFLKMKGTMYLFMTDA